MIFKDEGNAICEYNKNENVPLKQAFEVGSDDYMAIRGIIHDVEIHHDLRRGLTKYISTVNHIDLNSKLVNYLEG